MARRPGRNKREPTDVRPRLGGYVERERGLRFRSSLLRRVARMGGPTSRSDASGQKTSKSSRRAHWDPRGSKAAYVLPAAALSRRVVVKARYQEMGEYGRKAARLHLDYIQRDGVERDGSRGKLYDGNGAADPQQFGEPLEGEKRQYRFILSPEDASQMELGDFTRRLVGQMEKDLGRELHWAAVDHYNTDQPHAHLVIRGVDKTGKELFIDGQYLAHGIRTRARELVTEELGLRTEDELERQLSKEIGQERLTSIDRRIQAQMKDAMLDVREYPSRPWARAERLRIVGRMATLEKLGLARCLGGAHWRLQPEWDSTLKGMGERNDIIKRMHAALGSDPSRYRSFLDRRPPDGPVEGIVRHKGLHDELRGTLFAAVETISGETYYVPLSGQTAEATRVGDIVRATVEEESRLKSSDVRLARLAAANGGQYSAKVHRRSIAADLVTVQTIRGPQQVSADEFVEVHEKRLHRLAGLGVGVKRQADGQWVVPADLEQRMRDLDEQRPQTRTTVRVLTSLDVQAQAKVKGPTWLDSVPDAVRAPFGFGAQVEQAMARRSQVLDQLGVAPADPCRVGKLRQFEREQLGQSLAHVEDRRFIPGIRKDSSFNGQAEARTLQSGQRVVVVRGQKGLMVVPLAKGMAKPAPGRPVTLIRGADSKYSFGSSAESLRPTQARPPGSPDEPDDRGASQSPAGSRRRR